MAASYPLNLALGLLAKRAKTRFMSAAPVLVLAIFVACRAIPEPDSTGTESKKIVMRFGLAGLNSPWSHE